MICKGLSARPNAGAAAGSTTRWRSFNRVRLYLPGGEELDPEPRLLGATWDGLVEPGWSEIAAELGLTATVGAGSAAMRAIRSSHCVVLSSPTTATGAGAA